jgi:hypothetical protein
MKVLASVAHQMLWHSHRALFELAAVDNVKALTPDGAQLLLTSQTPLQLAELISQYPQAEFVVAYEAPELMLGSLLAAGQTPAQAAEQWVQQTEALLQLQQQQRRRLKLFNLAAMAQNSVEMPDWVRRKNNAKIESGANVYGVIGAQLLRQHRQCSALQQRLFASSLSLSEQMEYQFDLAILLQHASNSDELQATVQERDLLLMQLQHVQEELEQLFQQKTVLTQQHSLLQQEYQAEAKSLTAKLSDGEKKLSEAISQLTKSQTELSQITAEHLHTVQQLKDTAEERDLFLMQMQHVQEELERHLVQLHDQQQKFEQTETARLKQQQREVSKLESQLRKTKARAAGAEHQQQLLQQELKAVKRSALWRSAAPVRILSRLVNKQDKTKQKLQQEAALIITSEYFDIEWYLERYPDVAATNINPAEHYLKFGASEGRMPGPLFDGDWYLQHYPDVAESGINPLLHFIKFGQLEGRSASPLLLTDNSAREE